MYFIPGEKNGEAQPQKNRNIRKKRPLRKWAAVFVLSGFALLVYRIYPGHYLPGHSAATHHSSISAQLWQDKDFGLPEYHPGDEIVRHFAYTLCYSEKDEEAAWVAYTLKKSYLEGTEKRESKFEPDPDVVTGSAEPGDYRNSGYDKGHLAPAADMKWDPQAMRESFYLSNVCPQDHKFNEGIWADLEKAVRSWARADEIEYIVTGPVLPEPNAVHIGREHVTVPSFFYKVVFSPNPSPKAIGFIIPNEPGKKSFWRYACSLTDVEKATHIHFFPKLPPEVSSDVKAHFEIKDWHSPDSY